ncbi:MAG: hypothetical protein LBK94_03795, partial [Prevotellaceae bacterium]|nr:hypothetical protein [Prevotellaceae bacterium]
GKTATCEVTVTPPPDISIDVTPDGTNTFAFYATATRLTVDWGDGATEEFTNIDIHTDAVTHTYANNEKRLVTIIAEGLTEFGDDTTPLGSGSGGVTTNRSIAGSMEKINCSHCPDLKGIYILHNALTEADMSGAPQVENVFLVGNGNLAALNLTGCTALSYLWCSYTQLAALDVSDCTNLTRLDCAYNQLETLDVSGCPNLIEFYCINNQLTSLDVSNHTALTRLSCDENQLGSLNISGCTALVELNCGRNQLTSLDASTNTALTRLHCYVNQLGSLDVSGCTALVYLDCGINRLTGLDVSSNTAIKQLYCDENQFSATALNNVFTALPSRVPSDYARIYITENPGTSACNTSIATAKNWTVVNE